MGKEREGGREKEGEEGRRGGAGEGGGWGWREVRRGGGRAGQRGPSPQAGKEWAAGFGSAQSQWFGCVKISEPRVLYLKDRIWMRGI